MVDAIIEAFAKAHAHEVGYSWEYGKFCTRAADGDLWYSDDRAIVDKINAFAQERGVADNRDIANITNGLALRLAVDDNLLTDAEI